MRNSILLKFMTKIFFFVYYNTNQGIRKNTIKYPFCSGPSLISLSVWKFPCEEARQTTDFFRMQMINGNSHK